MKTVSKAKKIVKKQPKIHSLLQAFQDAKMSTVDYDYKRVLNRKDAWSK